MLSARFVRERVRREKRGADWRQFLADHRTYIYSPFSRAITAFVIFTLIVLFIFIFLGLIGAAFGRIGFSAQAITLLLLAVLVGSFINIPLFTVESREPVMQDAAVSPPLLRDDVAPRSRQPPWAHEEQSLPLTSVAPSFHLLSRFISSGDFQAS